MRGLLEEPSSPESLVLTSHQILTPSSVSLCFLMKAPCHLLCFHSGNGDHGTEKNQDPISLDGFISIQLHSRACRFLISHFTIKDEGQGRAGGAVLSAACPAEKQLSTWRGVLGGQLWTPAANRKGTL